MIANTLYEEKISLWNWFWSESRLGSLCLGRICSWLLDHSQEQSTEDAQGLCFVSVSRSLLRTLRQSKFVFPWPSSCWKLFYEAVCKASVTWRFDFAGDLWFPHQYIHPHETAAVWSILWAIICDFLYLFAFLQMKTIQYQTKMVTSSLDFTFWYYIIFSSAGQSQSFYHILSEVLLIKDLWLLFTTTPNTGFCLWKQAHCNWLKPQMRGPGKGLFYLP